MRESPFSYILFIGVGPIVWFGLGFKLKLMVCGGLWLFFHMMGATRYWKYSNKEPLYLCSWRRIISSQIKASSHYFFGTD